MKGDIKEEEEGRKINKRGGKNKKIKSSLKSKEIINETN